MQSTASLPSVAMFKVTTNQLYAAQMKLKHSTASISKTKTVIKVVMNYYTFQQIVS
jgi:hypothetical protein